MGRLIKNHWARLIILTAGAYQIAAAIEGFFWPKIFWDFATKTLDAAVKPFPTLQIINLVMGIWVMAWEWPLSFIAGTAIHRSLEARLAFLPLAALAAVLTYQGTNAALYYLVAMVVEFWAFSEGEQQQQQTSLSKLTAMAAQELWTSGDDFMGAKE
ncbi:pro41 protein [Diaporthe eres]|nr:pro41 protein [Diaporthe eres]